MKKQAFALAAAISAAVTGLYGCSGGTSSTSTETAAAVEVPTEPFGDTIQYDPSVPVNNGEDIAIEFWEWGSDELFQQIIDGYTAIHPNVTI